MTGIRWKGFTEFVLGEFRRGAKNQTVIVLSPPLEEPEGTFEVLVTLRNVGGKRREDFVTVEALVQGEWVPARDGWQMPSDTGAVRQCWFHVDTMVAPSAFRVHLSDRTVEMEVEDDKEA